MTFKQIFLSCLLLSVSTGFSRVIFQDGSSQLDRSKRSVADTNVATHIRQGLESFRSLMKTGIPEIGVAPLEPIRLDNVSYDGDASGVQVKSNFTNMTLYGVSTLEIKRLDVDLSRSSLNLDLHFKNWTIIGTYNLTGKVIKFIPIYGNGTFDMQATDVIVTAAGPLQKHPNGTLSVQQLNMNVQADDVNVHFHDLYGGGALSGFANRFANFFGNRVFDNAKPKLIERMIKFLVASLNRRLNDVNVMKS